MKYLHTMVRVTDLEKSVAFYTLLGLRELRRIDNERGRFTLVFMAAEGDEQARPFARAQRDFLERHPLAVLPVLRRALAGEDADPCFTVLLATLHDWLKLDLAWRKESLEEDP